MPSPHLLALTLASLLTNVVADSDLDLSRTGNSYTSMPLYRNGAGTNVLEVGIGSPEVVVNLTCSTNVEFLMVASDSCEDCVEDADSYSVTDSSSVTTTQTALVHTFSYPDGSTSSLSLSGQLAQEILTDERNDNSTTRPFAIVTQVQIDDPNGDLEGTNDTLSDGTSGFWGLGVYQSKKTSSMIGSMLNVDSDGTPSQRTSFSVGFDISNYTRSSGDAGTVHWGGVPNDSWTGDFTWSNANTSVGGSWGFGVDQIGVEDDVIDLGDYFATIDPGFDAIYVPTSIAESFFSKVSDASRDLTDTTRWNLPCGTNISATITISDRTYAIAASQLVQARDTAGRTCWGSVVAWQNGSLPEAKGEIRLGTPFMSNVYSVLYYTEDEQYVGLAGKPNSVNTGNLASRSSGGHRNAKLAGILVGCLLGAFILLLAVCYSRNRNSFQSIWLRTIRRQQRAQMNMMVRSATLPIMPPHMMAGPMGGPMMASHPMMGAMGPMGPMGPMPMSGPGTMRPMGMGAGMGVGMPMGMGGMYHNGGYQPVPPPAYQAPVDRSQHIPEQNQALLEAGHPELGYSQHEKMPSAIDQKPQGYYSPQLQETSSPRSAFFPYKSRIAKSNSPPAAQRQDGSYGSQSSSGGSRNRVLPFGSRNVSPASMLSHGRNSQQHGNGDRQRAEQDFAPYPGAADATDTHTLPHPDSSGFPKAAVPIVPIQDGAYTRSKASSETKRYFTWRPGGDAGKGMYKPVVPSGEQGRSKRIWNSGRSGGWKEAEREKERGQVQQGWAQYS